MGWAEAFSRGPKPWPPYLAFAQDPGEPDSHLGEPLGPSPRLDRQVLRCHQRLCGLKEETAVTWKSCGLSDSGFLGAGVLLFLLPPGW